MDTLRPSVELAPGVSIKLVKLDSKSTHYYDLVLSPTLIVRANMFVIQFVVGNPSLRFDLLWLTPCCGQEVGYADKLPTFGCPSCGQVFTFHRHLEPWAIYREQKIDEAGTLLAGEVDRWPMPSEVYVDSLDLLGAWSGAEDPLAAVLEAVRLEEALSLAYDYCSQEVLEAHRRTIESGSDD